MQALDLGTGYDFTRWLPGADLASQNLDVQEVTIGRKLGYLKDLQVFDGHVSSESPLPVPDGTYDLVWFSYGLYTNWYNDRPSIAKEITRITCERATLVLRDYTQWYHMDHGDDLQSVTLKEWVANIEEIFPEWTLDYVAVEIHSTDEIQVPTFEDGSSSVIAILKKGWG